MEVFNYKQCSNQSVHEESKSVLHETQSETIIAILYCNCPKKQKHIAGNSQKKENIENAALLTLTYSE